MVCTYNHVLLYVRNRDVQEYRMPKSSGSSRVIIIVLVVIIIYLLVKKQRSRYSHDHPILDRIRENFGKLDPEYSKIPLRVGDSAYTEDKSVITLCLQDPHTGKYYDMNTLMYVSLHELAHVVSKDAIQHKGSFPKNFAKLLHEASILGIYDPRRPISLQYCGTGPTD